MRAINIRVPCARRVLDFGCGTGWVLAEAKVEGCPLRVGVDYSLDALPVERGGPQRLQDRANQPIAFTVGDGVCLPFADGTFDIVVGHVSIPYMNTRSGLREIYRVLAPGGSVFLTFHSFRFARKWLGASIRTRNWKGIVVSLYLAINGILNHLTLPQTPVWWNTRVFETVNTPRGVWKAAEREGFTLISTEHAASRIFFVFTARKPNPVTGAVLPAPSWAVYSKLADGL